MFCRECGRLIEEGNKFCTYCGTKVLPIGSKKIENDEKMNVEKNDSADVDNKNVEFKSENVVKGSNVSSNNSTYKKEDKASVGFNILGFFIPIVGLILFLVWLKDSPKKAKFVGISALIGFILQIVFSIVATVMLFRFIYLNRYKFNDYNRYNDYYYRYQINRDYDNIF